MLGGDHCSRRVNLKVRWRRRTALSGALLSLCLIGGGGLAFGASSTGYDISYPQCNAGFPSPGTFGIVGVNGGKPFGANPCLGTGSGSSELQWAGMNAGLYANTADPGPALSTHWPNGQTSPRYCDPANNSTADCAYDYGWNAAADSYADAVNAYVSLGWAATGATRTPVANQWWLDVESANSWMTNTAMNVADLQGAADYLASVGASGVGFYANSSDWQSVTGATASFSAHPSWTPGAGSLAQAQASCGAPGITGGPVALAQYLSGGFDGDVQCAQTAPLALSAAQTITAGTTSSPMTVSLPQASTTAVVLTLSSSSAAGRFSTGTDASNGAGTLSLTIPAGGASATFYYYDTRAGAPALTAAASGYGNGSRTETVTAASLATIAISPNPVQVRSSATVTLSSAGSDRYGNRVPVAPTWSVSPSLGTFSAQTTSSTTFRASTPGAGSIYAKAGSVTGTAALTVTARHK